MDGVPGLRKMKAGSLRPELYDEIAGFLSSFKPDFAISGKTSLYAIYACLRGAKKRKIPAKQLRKAEEMIRALCAAVEAKELKFGRAARPAAEERKGAFPRIAGPEEVRLTEALRAKFAQLGISDERAIKRVLAFLGEDEFLKRHAKVLDALPERAYVPFFSKIPDFLSGSDFYPALMLLQEKIGVIDRVFGSGKPKELDYERDPTALFRSFREIAERTGMDEVIGRTIRRWGSERPERALEQYKRLNFRKLTDPKMLRQLLEGLGYYVTPITADVDACIKRGGSGEVESILLIHGRTAYEIQTLSVLLWQAGITPERLRAAGVSG